MNLTPPITGDSGIDNFQFTRDAIKHPNVHIGEYSYGVPEILISKGATVTIGKFCSIAPGVHISASSGHRTDWVSTYPFALLNNWFPAAAGREDEARKLKGDIHIGHDVWIGRNALILPGVTLGHGAIIAANTVVTKNVPAYHLMAGNPGIVKRARFPLPEIAALLDLKWWDWPIEKIQANAAALADSSVNRLMYFKDY